MHSQLSRTLWTMIVVALLGAAAKSAIADVLLSQQGKLTGASDVPLPDGSYEVTFKLIDRNFGDVTLWTETQTVSLKNGLFSVTLGAVTPLTEDIISPPGTEGYYIGDFVYDLVVKVTGYPDLPGVRLTGVPYAAVATRLTGDVATRPGEIDVREPGVPGYVHLATAGLVLYGDPLISILPTAGIASDLPGGPGGPIMFIKSSPTTPGNAVEITPDGVSLDQNGDGDKDVDINTLTNIFNVANSMVTTYGGPTKVNDLFSVDVTDDGVKEWEITPGQIIGRNPFYLYIPGNSVPVISVDNFGKVTIDPNGSVAGGIIYKPDLSLNVRGGPVTLDLTNDGTAEVELHPAGFANFNFDGAFPIDYGLTSTGAFINKSLVVSPDGVLPPEFQVTATGTSLFNPGGGAGNELAVTDNAVAVNGELNVTGAVNVDGQFTVNSGATTFPNFEIGPDRLDINTDGDEFNEVEVTRDDINFDVAGGLGADVQITGGATPTVTINGDLNVTGSKGFVQQHPSDQDKEIVYVCLEGGEAGTYTRGSGKLDNGTAIVELPEHFALVTNIDGLTAQITPRGPVQSMLYVESVTPTHLIVKASNLDDKDVRFDYLINGVRAGFEDHQVIRDKKEFTSR